MSGDAGQGRQSLLAVVDVLAQRQVQACGRSQGQAALHSHTAYAHRAIQQKHCIVRCLLLHTPAQPSSAQFHM